MNRTGADVSEYLASVTPAARRDDAARLAQLMRAVSGSEPEMWSGGIVGFGGCRYEYPTGTTGESPIIAFAPRKIASTLYLLDGIAAHAEPLARLGTYTTGAGCLYLKRLGDVDLEVLEEILAASHATATAGGNGYASITVTG
jgi:hypothetical protein